MTDQSGPGTEGDGPRIGIVVPAHNAERYLPDMLRSAEQQEFRDWACVVVDDGSTDGTAAVAESFAARDRRFRVLRQPNRGPGVARNIGFATLHRSVEYVTFMDADDVWTADALRVLLDAATSDPALVGAHGLGDYIDESGSPIEPGSFAALGRSRQGCGGGRPRPWPATEPTTFENVVSQSVLFPPGLILAKASAYRTAGLFDPTAHLAEDWDVLVRLTRLGPLAFVDAVVLGYRRHGANVGAGAEVRRAAARVRQVAYWSPENSPSQRRVAGQAWRAAQVVDARQRRSDAARSLRSGHLGRSVANLARLPVIAARYLRGRPPPPSRRR